MNNKIGYEVNLVSVFFFFFFFWESQVGNQGSVTFEIRMQELETWRKLPLIHYTLPLPPTPLPHFELYRNVRRQRGMFQFWSAIDQKLFGK